jgi:hypothetical protein
MHAVCTYVLLVSLAVTLPQYFTIVGDCPSVNVGRNGPRSLGKLCSSDNTFGS